MFLRFSRTVVSCHGRADADRCQRSCRHHRPAAGRTAGAVRLHRCSAARAAGALGGLGAAVGHGPPGRGSGRASPALASGASSISPSCSSCWRSTSAREGRCSASPSIWGASQLRPRTPRTVAPSARCRHRGRRAAGKFVVCITFFDEVTIQCLACWRLFRMLVRFCEVKNVTFDMLDCVCLL